MATVNGTDYYFIDMQQASGGNITHHLLKDKAGRDAVAPTEATSTASAAHATWSYFFYNGVLYQATADIASGGTITPNTNCKAVTVGGQLGDLKSAITGTGYGLSIEGKNKVTISSSDLVQGGYEYGSLDSSKANRVSLYKVVPVYPGMKILFTAGTKFNQFYCKKYDSNLSNFGNISWGNSNVNIDWNGYAIILFRYRSGSSDLNLTPSDYDATMSFLSFTGEFEVQCFPFTFDSWTNKGVNATSGELDSDNATRLAMKSPYYPMNKKVLFYTKPGYEFLVYAYDYAENYQGLLKTGGTFAKSSSNAKWVTEYEGDYGRYGFRFVIAKADHSQTISSSEADCFCFTDASYLTRPDYSAIASNYNAEANRTGEVRINPDLWEIGQCTASTGGWLYPENGTYVNCTVCPKEGYYLELQAGDVISLTDYTNAKFIAGYRIGTTYYTFENWKTADTVVPHTGEYVISIRTRDETDISNKSDLLDLLRIKRVKSSVYFNVKTYGATGNGTSNDRTAIQNAFDACNTAGGGTVIFPAGTYKVNSTLIFYSNTHILLDCGATILRGGSYNMMLQTYCTDETLEYNGVHDVIIEGGTIDAGTGITQGCAPIGMIHAKNITIKNVRMRHNNVGYHCCDICGCKNITIEDCIFEDPLTTDSHAEIIQFDSPTSRTTFPSSQLTEGANTFDSTITQNVEVKGCRFFLNDVSPACGNHTTSANKNILIHDNIITGEAGSYGAISFDDPNGNPNATTQVMIHNNIIEGATYGFNFSAVGTGKIYVRDNIFKSIGTLKINPDSPVGIFSDNIELE